MRLAVLLYADADNPDGIPGTWPAQVKELKESDPDPTEPWKEMWLWEYNKYVSEHRAAYDAWLATQPPIVSTPGED